MKGVVSLQVIGYWVIAYAWLQAGAGAGSVV